MQSPRFALRDATAAAHQRVDDAFTLLDVASPAGYRAFLVAHAAAFLPCEQALEDAGVSALLPDWPDRRRSEALLRDLADLGVSSPRWLRAPALPDMATMFGMLYVLEGSRLGGALLSRQLQANPDLVCRAASRYLDHGDRRTLWPGLIAALDASSDVRRRASAALDGALATFSLFERAADAAVSPPLAGAA